MTQLKFSLISLVFLLLSPFTVAVNSGQHTSESSTLGFVYLINTPNGHQLEAIIDFNHRTKINLSSIQYYALSPNSPLMAYSDEENWVYLLNILSKETIQLHVQIMDNTQIIYDSHQQRSASLHWSPDGNYLAFWGSNDQLYIYDVPRKALQAIDLPIVSTSGVIDINAWSPDSQWLTIVGRWRTQSEANNEPSNPFRTAIIANDGSSFTELGNTQRTCTLSWSPNQRYLVSETLCFDQEGQLLFFTLAPDQHLTHLTSPVQHSQLMYPLWVDDQRLRLVQQSIQSDDVANSWIVEFNASDNTFTPVPNSERSFSWHYQDNGYIFALLIDEHGARHLEGFDMLQQHELPSIYDEDLCPVFNIRTDRSRGLMAILKGCVLNAPSRIEILNIHSSENILTITGGNNEALLPLGFLGY